MDFVSFCSPSEIFKVCLTKFLLNLLSLPQPCHCERAQRSEAILFTIPVIAPMHRDVPRGACDEAILNTSPAILHIGLLPFQKTETRNDNSHACHCEERRMSNEAISHKFVIANESASEAILNTNPGISRKRLLLPTSRDHNDEILFGFTSPKLSGS